MKIRTLITALLATTTLLAGCRDAGTAPELDESDEAAVAEGFPGLSLLSRTVYLGGDIAPILGALAPDQIPVLVAEAWNQINVNDLPARAAALALEIEETRPDVIGLQEVAIFRIQAPVDFLAGNPQPAPTVAFDYFALLTDALEAREPHDQVVSVAGNTDIELPAALSASNFIDVRWTDRDVILVRDEVEARPGYTCCFDPWLGECGNGCGSRPGGQASRAHSHAPATAFRRKTT